MATAPQNNVVPSSAPLRRLVCDLNELLGNTRTSALTILGDQADQREGEKLATPSAAAAKKCFVTRDLEKGTTEVRNEAVEYSSEELSRFEAIQAHVRELAFKYNKGEEEIEKALQEADCSWDNVRKRFKAEKVPEWNEDEDRLIKKLLEKKSATEVLARVSRLSTTAADNSNNGAD